MKFYPDRSSTLRSSAPDGTVLYCTGGQLHRLLMLMPNDAAAKPLSRVHSGHMITPYNTANQETTLTSTPMLHLDKMCAKKRYGKMVAFQKPERIFPRFGK